MSASQISGQMKGQYTFSSCNASSMTWQLKNGNTIQATANVNPSSATVTFDIPTSVASGNYTLRAFPTNCSGDGSSVYEKPFAYSKPGGRIGIDEAMLESKDKLVVSPNPSTGYFKVSFYVEPGQQANLSVTDLQGKIWYEKSFQGEGHQTQAIHMASQARGFFVVSVKVKKRIMSKKVLVHP
jgi:hypothetical protein